MQKNKIERLIESVCLEPLHYHPERPYILVNGLGKNVHTALVNIAIGRAAQDALDLNVGYLSTDLRRDGYAHALFQKAGIKPVDITVADQPLWYKVLARTRGYLEASSDGDKLLRKHVGNVRVGDLIYDSVKRDDEDVRTIDDASLSEVRHYTELAIRLRRELNALFRRKNIRYVAPGKTIYLDHGLIARTALQNDVAVLSSTELHIRRINSRAELDKDIFARTREELDNLVRTIGEERLRAFADQLFEGTLNRGEVKFAFAQKNAYEAESLRAAVGAEDSPMAVIAPHCFSDASHRDREMIYNDYHEWLVRTLALTRHIDGVRWVVKPHPCAFFYGEEGAVEEMVSQYEHVTLTPEDVKTDSVLQTADAIIAVRSDIGMEAVVFNCGVILAGNAYYDQLESVRLCLNESDYVDALSGIERKAEVSEKEKLRALASIYNRHWAYEWRSPILGQARPIGLSSEERDETDRHEIRRWAEFLETNAYEDDSYYQQLLSFFKDDRKMLSIEHLLNKGGEKEQ